MRDLKELSRFLFGEDDSMLLNDFLNHFIDFLLSPKIRNLLKKLINEEEL